MPKINRNKYLKRTNKEGTCLWCGANTGVGRCYGYAKDEDGWVRAHFCSLICATRFAVAALKNGFRLKPFEGEV